MATLALGRGGIATWGALALGRGGIATWDALALGRGRIATWACCAWLSWVAAGLIGAYAERGRSRCERAHGVVGSAARLGVGVHADWRLGLPPAELEKACDG